MSTNVSPLKAPPQVRVYLPTYRRSALLPRAVASLQAQTLVYWVCELHNDDPEDPFPGKLVDRLADPRIQLVNHPKNLGPIASFNLFYHETSEPFYALLEDDNTWDPTFLATLVRVLEDHPSATLAWCNQRLAYEQPDGTCQETAQRVNPQEPTGAPPRALPWGQWRQVMGALHANGAMVMRSRPGQIFPTPQILFGGMEAFRERMFPHPLIYLPETLASYTVTQRTARSRDRRDWGAFLVASAVTFFRHAQLNTPQFAALWEHFAEQQPPMTNELIATALICPEARPLLRQARPRNWLRFIRSIGRRPGTWWHTFRVSLNRPEWWRILDRHTAERFAERKTQGLSQP